MNKLLINNTPRHRASRPATTISTRLLLSFAAAAAIIITLGIWGMNPTHSLSVEAALTLSIFVLAIWAWIFSPLQDTHVALSATVLLIITGIMPSQALTGALGHSTIWLLVAAFVLAQGMTICGIADRLASNLILRAKGVASLFILLTLALYLTSFAIPSTSGRAALALPLFTVLAGVLSHRPALVKAISLLIPSVVLVSAVSSYIGAGAHLITDEILATSGYEPIGFIRWMLLGAGLGLLASFLCTGLIYWLFVPADERRQSINLNPADFQADRPQELTAPEGRVLVLLLAVILGWATEGLHGIDTTTVALIGALIITLPGFSGAKLPQALKKAPWPLLIFMAATLALGSALVETGAASWLADALFTPIASAGPNAGLTMLIAVILLSTVAHLFIQSRSARSAVLIPLVILAATPMGLNPVALAFASTAAAGFCHTLTSSAKPVALFSQVEDTEVYTPADLLKLSVWLAPLHALLILVFSLWVWPLLGLPLWKA